MNNDQVIINNLRKDVTDIKVYSREALEGYKRKELEFRYLTKDSLLEKTAKEDGHREGNAFWYTADEKTIDELAKKDHMELLEFLAPKHLERNQGCGENPKRFQTPCYLCNQKTLTTLGWGGEGHPDNLERFFCRLCRTSFGWIDIKDDPIELQLEMRGYYLIFKKKQLEKDEKKVKEIAEEINKIEERISKAQQFVMESKEFIKVNEPK